ncbi:MAG: exo-alpha-sialidase, partial [Verrucomicrobia bacterium]|nr:exo-alpha-sialidase [Verrucomicrobiota bacterium]
LQTSDDHGKTWSQPRDIRDEILQDHLTRRDFVFVTSGRGMQTRSGLIIHTVVHVGKAGYLFGSSDQGKTWGALKKASPFSPANESKFVELSDGTWMINARVNGSGYRYVHRSTDQGKTWISKKETNLPDPGCNAELLVYTSKKDGYAKDRLLFVNSHSQKGRKNLVLSISYDNGNTWAFKKCIEKGATVSWEPLAERFSSPRTSLSPKCSRKRATTRAASASGTWVGILMPFVSRVPKKEIPGPSPMTGPNAFLTVR